MPNSGHGGPGTRVMTIFGFYVSTQIPNIEKNEVYWGLWTLGDRSSFFIIKFPVECRRNHVGGSIFDLSYDHVYKSVYFVKVELGHTHG